MSSFAEDKVKKYIRNNLRKFYRIRVAQMLHLRCLTDIDTQEIRAFCDRKGNNLAVWEFLERLQSREGWLQILIEELEKDNLGDLANDLRQVYNTYEPRNPLPSSSSAAEGNIPPSIGSGASGFSLPPSAEQQPSPPFNLPSSRRAQPAPQLPAESQRAPSSTPEPDLAEMSSYHAPVQETKPPSENSEAMAEPKAMHSTRSLESSMLPKSSAASPSKTRVPAGKEEPSNGQAPSATNAPSGFLIQDRLEETPVGASPGTPRPDASGLSQKWDGRHKRPVCVSNGYFGNANRVALDTGASSTLGAPLGPKALGNQPVEDYFSSSDSSPLAAPSSQDDSQEEKRLGERKVQAPVRSKKGNSVVEDSSASNLQRGLGAGQEGAADQWRNSPTITGDYVPANAASSSTPLLGSSLSSRSQQPWVPSENVCVFPDPTAVPSKWGRPPPSDFEGSSSMDVVPPNSHTERSSALSSVDSKDPKSSVREEKRPAGRLDETHAAMLGHETVRGTQHPDIAGESMVNSVKRRNSSSRENRVFYSNCDDDSPCKPGILTSVPDAGPPGQLLTSKEPNPEYSGRSDRFCISPDWSLNSDPIMLSDSSQNSQLKEERSGSAVGTVLGRNVMDESLLPTNDNQEVSGSIRTFGFRLDENASNDRTEAPNVIGDRGCWPSQSPGAFPDLASGHQPTTPVKSQPENSSQKEEVGATPPWIPSDYTWLLAGIALASVAAMAFVLYKKK